MKIKDKQKTPFTYLRILTAILLTLSTTSCDIFTYHFINAVGGLESDCSNEPEFAHLFNRTYEFKKDVILYQYSDECRRNTLHIELPGTCSIFPKTVDDCESHKHSSGKVKDIVRTGTKFSIIKVVKSYTAGGFNPLRLYINLENGNFEGADIEAGTLYHFNGPNTGILEKDWVKISD